MSSVLPVFDTFHEEARHIGRMLAGYGELEFDLCQCLGHILDDEEAALRVLFRRRGEDARIAVADALMRRAFSEIKLGDAYTTMLGAIRWCKSVRNTYAHCHWHHVVPYGLVFTDLEQAANSSSLEPAILKFYPVDVQLLARQEAYFVYARELLAFLDRSYSKGAFGPKLQLPAPLQQPPQHNRRD